MTQSNSNQNRKESKEKEMTVPSGAETKYYNYRCSDCGYKQKVPDFVVDEFAAVEGLEPGNMPVLQCGSCGKKLKCVD